RVEHQGVTFPIQSVEPTAVANPFELLDQSPSTINQYIFLKRDQRLIVCELFATIRRLGRGRKHLHHQSGVVERRNGGCDVLIARDEGIRITVGLLVNSQTYVGTMKPTRILPKMHVDQ